MEPEIQLMADRLIATMEQPTQRLEEHRTAVSALRAELASVGHPMRALLQWDHPEHDGIQIVVDLDERGRAALDPAVDDLFDLALAQAINGIGALILSRDSPIRVSGRPIRELQTAIELEHGAWRYESDAAGSPRWALAPDCASGGLPG